jgi:hypothetical protein
LEDAGQRHRVAFARAATASVAAVTAVAFTTSLLQGARLPSPLTVGLFAAFLIASEHAALSFESVNVSASYMWVMAFIAASNGRGSVVGAGLVALGGGLTWRALRRRRWQVITFNCCQYALAAMGAAASFELVRQLIGGPVLPLAAAAIAFAVVNVGLILPASAVDSGEPMSGVWREMAPALPNYLAFGLLGALVGEFYHQLGPVALVLLATPVAMGRSAFASFLEMRTAHEATIAVFLRAIEAKDPYTAGHTRRVAGYSAYIGEELGLSPARMQQLERSALMHDIGKLAVPSALLTKPGQLTPEEFALVQRHAHVCVDILSQVEFLRPMTAAASGHHARYDGGGYGNTGPAGPGGHKHSTPSLDASIVAVADAFDAMTSTRAYRRALSQEVAFDELRAKSGTQLHPDCVAALIRAIEGRDEHHGLGYEEEIVLYDTEPPVVGPGSAGLGDVDLREPLLGADRWV